MDQNSRYGSQRTEPGGRETKTKAGAVGSRATGKVVLGKYLRQGLISAGSSLLTKAECVEELATEGLRAMGL